MDIRKGHHYSLVILLSLSRARALVISPSYMVETHAMHFRAAQRARRSKNIKFVLYARVDESVCGSVKTTTTR